ncbi:MAG: hypothetical protein ACRYG8_25570 [Janthinobacterium lividum]
MADDASDKIALVRGELYEWEWPMMGAGVMAQMRGLLPIGRAVTREDVPTMHKGVASIGFQVLQDDRWLISPDWIVENGCRFWKKSDD